MHTAARLVLAVAFLLSLVLVVGCGVPFDWHDGWPGTGGSTGTAGSVGTGGIDGVGGSVGMGGMVGMGGRL